MPNAEKLPVFRTVARAYGFAFGNLATIIGLVWLPLLLLAGSAYFLAVEVLSVVAGFSSGGAAVVDELQRTGFVFYYFLFAVILLYAVMAVPVMRQALGLRTGGAFVHFGLGAAELRTFAALFLLYLLVTTVSIVSIYAFVLLFLVVAAGAGVLGTIAGISPAVVTGASAIAAWIVYFAATIYVDVRLSYFVVAVTVAENRIDLMHAWNLTRGKFWRIFWILCAIRVPLMIIAGAFAATILGIFFGAGGMLAKPGSGFGATGSLEAVRHLLPVLIGIALFLEPMRLGLESGASAASFRALVPPDAAPPVDRPVTDSAPGDLRATDLAQAVAAS